MNVFAIVITIIVNGSVKSKSHINAYSFILIRVEEVDQVNTSFITCFL